MPYNLPYVAPGQVVGLLGGSFDPPHQGHVQITREAIKRFALDQVWWLVSPGNPLKERGPAPIEDRLNAANSLMTHPRVHITDIEARIGTRYTAETLEHLQRIMPNVRFVWLMGADNLTGFHRWDRWHDIMKMVPVGVLARPGDRMSARFSKAARVFDQARIGGRDSYVLGMRKAPSWCFADIPMRNESSTAVRRSGEWPQ
ncbi:nicotinate-nucleotide adenylyltransferase [Donghicola sp. XS_ASV15]|uniref:nicotinate-nucleotide adenylyltransferase n=1 Tax=Donghicola sp. XS_ASV15 TaxID=3241295 RepID=UPI003516CDBD